MTTATVGASVLDYMITGLSSNTGYSVTIKAINADNPAALSPGNYTLYATTSTPGKPTDPWGVRLNGLATSNAVALIWQDASRNGGSAITGYTINWLPPDGGGTHTLTSNVSQYRVENLEPGSRYTFNVIANAGDLSSSPGYAKVSAGTNALNGLSDPSGFAESPLTTATTFGLQWLSVPNVGSTTLSEYVVLWQPPDNNGYATFPRNAVEGSVTGLTANRQYTFNIYSVGVSGATVINSPGNFYVTGSTLGAGEPRAPYGLEINDASGGVTSNSVALDWTAALPGTEGDFVEFYTITATDVSGFTIVQNTSIGTFPDGAPTEYIFTGLSANTEYTFTIVAVTDLNLSAAEVDSLTVTTAVSGGPLDPVMFAVEGSITTTSVKIGWDQPTFVGSKTISSYSLTSIPAFPSQPRIISQGTDAYSNRETPITGLTSGKYVFTMVATDVSGVSSRGNNGLDVTINTAGAPGYPTGLEVNPAIPATSTAISVVWNSASRAGGSAIAVYNVYVTGVTADYNKTFTIPNTAFTISGLQPSTGYDINVTATNLSGFSSPLVRDNSIFAETHAEDAPGDPGFFFLAARANSPPNVPVDNNSIHVEWNTASADGGEDISGYVVTWEA